MFQSNIPTIFYFFSRLACTKKKEIVSHYTEIPAQLRIIEGNAFLPVQEGLLKSLTEKIQSDTGISMLQCINWIKAFKFLSNATLNAKSFIR
jgi:hypothetical protein